MIHGHLDQDGRLFVDNTLLAGAEMCDGYAMIRFAHDLVGEQPLHYLKCGQAIHKGLEVRFRGGSDVEALTTLRNEYDAWATAHVPEDERAYKAPNVRKVFEVYLRERPVSSMPFIVEQVPPETTLQVPLVEDGSIIYTWTLDLPRVRGLHDGLLAIGDHKTTSKNLDSRYRRQWRSSSQITGGLWGMQRLTGETFVNAYLNVIQIREVPSSTRTCSEHKVKYAECGELHLKSEVMVTSRSAEQIGRWHENAVRVATRYRDLLAKVQTPADLASVEYRGLFTGACARCDAEDFCAMGRPAHMTTSMFQTRAWDPMARD